MLHNPPLQYPCCRWDSPVVMCLRYGLGDQRNVVPFPAGETDLSRLQSTQFGFLVHPANYLIGTVGLTPRGVRLTSLHTLTLPAIETRSPIPQSVTKLPQQFSDLLYFADHRFLDELKRTFPNTASAPSNNSPHPISTCGTIISPGPKLKASI